MKRLLPLCALALLLCGGCGAREIDRLAVVSGLAFDWTGTDWQATAELAAVRGRDEGPAPERIAARGETPAAALREAGRRSGRPLWCAHAQVLVLGSDAAAQGLGFLTELLQSGTLPPGVPLAIGGGTGGALLACAPRLTGLESAALRELLENDGPTVTLGAFCAACGELRPTALPRLEAVREGRLTRAVAAGTVLFDGGRPQGAQGRENAARPLLKSTKAVEEQ